LIGPHDGNENSPLAKLELGVAVHSVSHIMQAVKSEVMHFLKHADAFIVRFFNLGLVAKLLNPSPWEESPKVLK
jgi:hypothetical protein